VSGTYEWVITLTPESNCTDGHDNDCDGATDLSDSDCWECTPGTHQLCPEQSGVCSGSDEVCTSDGQWPGCDYTSIPGYESTETLCDGLDNDCNGLIDEPFDNESCEYVCTANGYAWTGNGGISNCCGNDLHEGSPYEPTESSCTDGHDNDCDSLVDQDDPDCPLPDGEPCTSGTDCANGYCDNDTLGADFDPYKDEFHCFTPLNGYLDNQDYSCEVSSGIGDAACDEFDNGTDCSYLDGSHFWCNGSCQVENRDASPEACTAVGMYCAGGFSWLKAGEQTTPFAAGGWEYALGDTTSTECCGDDSKETPRHRNSSCSEPGCTPNDEPDLGDSILDRVCCNDTLDCVYNGNCYTSDADGGSSQVFGGDNPNTPSVFCEQGIWYDCDNSQGGCEEQNGRCGIAGGWQLSGEPGVGEYDSLVKPECCGDDADEYLVNSSEYQGHLATDVSCCDSEYDCVTAGKCNLSDSNGGSELHCYDGIDNDCDGATDFCDGRHPLPCSRYDGLDDECSTLIWGHVKNSSDAPIEGAKVTILTLFNYKDFSHIINFSAITDDQGYYSIIAYGNSTYDLVVERHGYNTVSGLTRGLEDGEQWELNITMYNDKGCQPDCTLSSDALCHPECNGTNGCLFYNRTSMDSCSGVPRDAIVKLNNDYTVECCTGSPFLELPRIQATVSVLNSTYTHKLEKLVLYRGKPVNMNIITFT